MTTERRAYIDWPRLIEDLQYLLGEPEFEGSSARVAVGTHAVAKYLHVPRTTLVRWLDGARLEYHQGCELIEAWKRLTGKGEQFLPITVATFSAARMR